ncbi:MAG: hypothetical protein FDX21_01140 [Chlorobium sp.]|nr:MAG: hypothetical protein FDX21_01140 [Chlorobium sp.]
MNILIDTNILIPLEDTGRVLDPSLAEMCRLADQHGHILYTHPSQEEDILRDSNEARKNIVLSRVKQYQSIPFPPQITADDLLRYDWKQNNDNDHVDNLLLHALCRGAVHFLVTGDKEIHKKAKQANVQEQVHRIDQFLAFLKSQNKDEQPPPFGIQERYLHQFDVTQPFFDSLREGYDQFNEWYLKSARNQRKAWCISDNGVVHAICIYKIEDRPCIGDGGLSLNGRALKLCTFKVGKSVRGRKLGERLLFASFKYAVENNIQYVYLHTFGEEHDMLVSLCLDYGFQYYGKYDSRDNVYLKEMICPSKPEIELDPLSYAIRYYPHYLDNPHIAKFIVPIQPEYYNDLFADTSDTARGLFSGDHSFYSPQSNTIKKAYICHSNTTGVRPGDLLLFFRTQDRKSIECIGVVEQNYRGRDIDKVLPLVSKRTVYSKGEIEKRLLKETLVILFRFIRNISPISHHILEKAEIKGPIQSIRKITHEQYLQCINRSVN